MNENIVGILGGGQLGRMLVEAAHRLNIKTVVLDAENAPAKQLTNSFIEGSFQNAADIAKLSSATTIITTEIEHVDTAALEKFNVEPHPKTIATIQDKFAQKQYLSKFEIPISPFSEVTGNTMAAMVESIKNTNYGFPMMLKSKKLAYDGRGNKVINTENDIEESINMLGGLQGELYVEKFVSFQKELAVMVAKSTTGSIVSYPCVETIQKDNICHLVIAPAQIDGIVAKKAQKISQEIVSCFRGAGIYGVELFLLQNGEIVFNEIAPRPHNSGHYTIEACHTSQFENHIRAVTGMPLGSPELKVNASIMINVIGLSEDLNETLTNCKDSLSIPGATVHLYGKESCRKGRKMGHITMVGDNMTELLENAQKLTDKINCKPAPLVGIIMGSDSDLPTVKPCAQLLEDFGVPFELSIVSAHRTPQRMFDYAKSAQERGIKVIVAAAGGAAHLPGMVAAITTLPVIGIPVALKVLDGVDSLHSIVQMPRGVPVATVAINNAVNAGLLAVRILSTSISILQKKLAAFAAQQESVVMEKVAKVDEQGWRNYKLE